MSRADSPAQTGEDPHAVGGRARIARWTPLLLVCAVASGLRLWGLERNGFANPYYAAAVRSMLKSPANFFFGAFDPVGLISVDKPPGALWIQAACAGVFGYCGMSVLLPQAVMGVGSVALTYDLVRRAFGTMAGFLAALFLAVTPISVADDRTNLPDTALLFVLLLAAKGLVLAIESGRLRSLLVSAALIGVGYNVKMVAALLVVPAFCVPYLVAAPVNLGKKLARLAAAALVVAVVSLSWSLVVEFTPVSRRPFVGGSRTNSALELAFGYNGLERVLGGAGRHGAASRATAPSAPHKGRSGGHVAAPDTGSGTPFDGVAGPLRFAGPVMAGQVTWLFPLALWGAAAIATRRPSRMEERAALLLWLGWLVTHWVVFSFAQGVLHEYYTTAMGPAVAALAGAGWVTMRNDLRNAGPRAVFLPAALVSTIAWECWIIGQVPGWRNWLIPGVVATGVAGIAGLAATRRPRNCPFAIGWEQLFAGFALSATLIGPVAWSLTPVVAVGDSLIPLAGPSLLSPPPAGIPLPGRPAFELSARGTRKLAEFLVANRHGEPIAMASMESFLAAPLIIDADLPVISLGGFAGNDRVITPPQFERMVRQEQVRFVLLVPGQSRANAELLNWVQRVGRPVDPKLWRVDEPEPQSAVSDGARAMFAMMRRETQLLDLRPFFNRSTQ